MPRVYTRRPVAERFWEKVDIRGENECWPWLAGSYRKGYGRFYVSKEHPVGAHRFAYEMARGDIPEGMFVMHACDNPPCVNPAHLSLGTHADNMRDMVAKGRHWHSGQTHCPQGHEFTPENTRTDARGWRVCCECYRRIAREMARQRRARLRAQRLAA